MLDRRGFLLAVVAPSVVEGAGAPEVKAEVTGDQADRGRTIYVSDFGAQGDGVHDDTRALLAAHRAFADECAAGRECRLVYSAGTYRISSALPLPDASGWVLEALGGVAFLQATDNEMILEMLVSRSQSRFKIIGGWRFSWLNYQPASQTRSVAIAIGSKVEVVDGVYGFEIQDVVFNRGFRGISTHPDTLLSNFKFPIWGYALENVSSYDGLSGATVALYSPSPNTGSPRASIRNFYCQGSGAREPRLIVKGVSQLLIENMEFNKGDGCQALFEACRQIYINNVRVEHAVTTAINTRILSFSGKDMQVIIKNVELQSHVVDLKRDGVSCYLMNINEGVLSVENFIALDVSTLKGDLFLLNTTNGGSATYSGDFYRLREGRTYLHNRLAAPSINPVSPQQVFFSLVSDPSGDTRRIKPVAGGGEAVVIGTACFLVGFLVRLTGGGTSKDFSVLAAKNGVAIDDAGYAIAIKPGGVGGAAYRPCWKALRPDQEIAHRFAPGDLLSFSVQLDADVPAEAELSLVALMAPVPR
jgi:hypothetical protein